MSFQNLCIPRSEKWEEMCLVAYLCCCVANDVVEGLSRKETILEIGARIMKKYAYIVKNRDYIMKNAK